MEEARLIDWESEETHLLLNPRLPPAEKTRLEILAYGNSLPGHIWLATSGTTGALKLVALSKHALLASAAAVNRHLAADASDVWLCVLPVFHVGGLGIYARAALAGGRVFTSAWDARSFGDLCRSSGVTLTSLVPAQVSDLLAAGVEVPASLRGIVVGGGAISPAMYQAAREAGWPLLPSYGMTECCSQIATATLAAPDLVLLDHVQVRTDSTGQLAFRGESLLTGYATDAGFVDPKIGGWFSSEDRGFLEGGLLRIEGRRDEFVKIGGESVDLSRLQRILEEVTFADAAIFAIPDERLGHVIALAIAGSDAASTRDRFNDRVLPFERIRRIFEVESIPRTSLGKIMRAALERLV